MSALSLFRLSVYVAVFLSLPTWVIAKNQVVPKSREQVRLTYAPLVKQVAPAVINIFTRRKQKETAVSPLFDDPFFKRFFRDFSFRKPNIRMQISLGSGVIVDRNGLIVTNNHVISGADEIIVGLTDRRQFQAKVVLADERTDLAVLQIEVENEKLPTIELMDSDHLEVGDLVLAIGNPFGVGQTVTSGIVSALARTRVGVSDFQFFIQTDAAINPGNSGGALITIDGRLAGINTAIFSRSGGSIGIGFAIPSNMVASVINAAITKGHIERPWIGAASQIVDGKIAEALGLKRPRGVIISKIFEGGPTARAGLRKGDIVLSFNQISIDDPSALSYRVALSRIGDKVELIIWRAQKSIRLEVLLTAAPENPLRNVTDIRGASPFSGARVANLSPALAEELGLDSMTYSSGVIILIVGRHSPAYRASLRPGDIIQQVNGRIIESVSALLKGSNDKNKWVIKFRRGNREFSLTVRK